MMHRLQGVGLPNVYLGSGFELDRESQGVAYKDVDGLFRAISFAIASRTGCLSAAELKFLRKRLEMTQEEIGALGGKTAQIAAQWEKGIKPVPLAESILLRLRWLAIHSRREVIRAIFQNPEENDFVSCDYVFEYSETDGWVEDIKRAKVIAHETSMNTAARLIADAKTSSMIYTFVGSSAIFPTTLSDIEEKFV